ncbi:hypothetical protein RRG08_015262 [Elysia crispata]|uniref:Uncharacterized protein n=1 Tax=Elysia crispata TaxID=231223 RepID=A0AAE1ATE5_9GAST|nr:hypothetical protein RRG08_015262 [Elysia crispata]
MPWWREARHLRGKASSSKPPSLQGNFAPRLQVKNLAIQSPRQWLPKRKGLFARAVDHRSRVEGHIGTHPSDYRFLCFHYAVKGWLPSFHSGNYLEIPLRGGAGRPNGLPPPTGGSFVSSPLLREWETNPPIFDECWNQGDVRRCSSNTLVGGRRRPSAPPPRRNVEGASPFHWRIPPRSGRRAKAPLQRTNNPGGLPMEDPPTGNAKVASPPTFEETLKGFAGGNVDFLPGNRPRKVSFFGVIKAHMLPPQGRPDRRKNFASEEDGCVSPGRADPKRRSGAKVSFPLGHPPEGGSWRSFAPLKMSFDELIPPELSHRSGVVKPPRNLKRPEGNVAFPKTPRNPRETCKGWGAFLRKGLEVSESSNRWRFAPPSHLRRGGFAPRPAKGALPPSKSKVAAGEGVLFLTPSGPYPFGGPYPSGVLTLPGSLPLRGLSRYAHNVVPSFHSGGYQQVLTAPV